MSGEWVDVKDLPAAIQDALKSVGYARSNIEVRASEKVVMGDVGSGQGRRSFAVLVNLDTGNHATHYGSWGGINAFDRANPVDNDTNEYALPHNGVAVKGSSGYGTTLATLHIPASMVSRVLTAGPRDELPQVEKDALYAYAYIIGGQYRRDELRRRNVPSTVVDGLVTQGLLKRNKAGATSVTTAGRNALGGYRGH